MKHLVITPSHHLTALAKRYVWWNTPEWAFNHPDVFLSNIMNLGCWDDIQTLRVAVGDDVLKMVLLNAVPGYFSYRSWDYWHIKFGMLPIPPLPKRNY